MLKRESLLRVKTSRDVTSSLRAAEHHIPPSLHDREGLEAAVQPDVPAAYLDRLLQKEKERFARQEEAVRRSQEKLLQARQKLKNRKHVNQQLSAYRRQLMDARAQGVPPPPPSPPQPPSAGDRPGGTDRGTDGLNAVPLKY